MEKVYIDGELAYPIWKITARWSQDGIQDPKYPNSYEGLAENRIWDSTNFMKMYKEHVSKEQVEKEANDWWMKYSTDKLSGKNPSDLTLTINFIRYETWCLTWFCHYTFDVGQTDQEALESFEKFVKRMEDMNLQNGHEINSPNYDQANWANTYYCLMGAEDRRRWYGGDYDNRTPAPCRCDGCKKYGIISINH